MLVRSEGDFPSGFVDDEAGETNYYNYYYNYYY
jgi:hypothetical protein